LVRGVADDVANRIARPYSPLPVAQFWVSFEVGQTVDERPHPNPDQYAWDAAFADNRRQQCHLLRDILGNPFRAVTFDPAWRTETAVALARQMYESRDFGAMPILADALQDAGCTSDDILAHCRGPGPHARGCWVVDLVLGKE
jgi:hypothetical protein